MFDAVSVFCNKVAAVNERWNNAEALCGPNSLCVRATNDILKGSSSAVNDYQKAMSVLDRWFVPEKVRTNDLGDIYRARDRSQDREIGFRLGLQGDNYPRGERITISNR